MANDYFASKGWLTKYAKAEDSTGAWQKYVDEVETERVQESRSMDQEPRNMYGQGSSVDHALRTVNPEQDSFKKLNTIDPGSTKRGKLSKPMSKKAKDKKELREAIENFSKRNRGR